VKGKALGIVGASGSGKTNLEKVVSSLLPADSGKINFQGERILRHEKIITYQ
jgi:peptide/nickel transport system ATP-binding protein